MKTKWTERMRALMRLRSAYASTFSRSLATRNLIPSFAVALPDLVTGPVFKTGGGR